MSYTTLNNKVSLHSWWDLFPVNFSQEANSTWLLRILLAACTAFCQQNELAFETNLAHPPPSYAGYNIIRLVAVVLILLRKEWSSPVGQRTLPAACCRGWRCSMTTAVTAAWAVWWWCSCCWRRRWCCMRCFYLRYRLFIGVKSCGTHGVLMTLGRFPQRTILKHLEFFCAPLRGGITLDIKKTSVYILLHCT